MEDRILEINIMKRLKLLHGDADNVASTELLKHICCENSESKWIQVTAIHMTMFGFY